MVVVVPCYNEESRLDRDRVFELCASSGCRVLLVDDGSTDTTPAMISAWIKDNLDEQVSLLRMPHNVGKGEAVRAGLLWSIEQGADIVAYCDADFSTPPVEVVRLIDMLRADDGVDAILGSRVAILGSSITRSAFRHYSGRVFATASAAVLGVPVYDTQCGAKAFRVTPRLVDVLHKPFVSRWVFDVELLGRLLSGSACDVDGGDDTRQRVIEVPLRHWIEPGGSKFAVRSRLRAVADLARIHRALREPGRATRAD